MADLFINSGLRPNVGPIRTPGRPGISRPGGIIGRPVDGIIKSREKCIEKTKCSM